MSISQETKEYIHELNKYEQNNFNNLIPTYRVDVDNVWYVIFYDKQNKLYSIHWFEGNLNFLSGNDIGTTKIFDVPKGLSNIEDILNWLVGKIQVPTIKHGIEPSKIKSITYIN